jgi:hypothetical protein
MSTLEGFGPPQYKGNTYNAKEQARFDFPESSYAGQPVGIPRAGSQANNQHNVLTQAEPTYVASPIQTAIASSPINMPRITQLSPQKELTNSGRRRDQGKYLDELQITMMKKQQEIAMAEMKQREYSQRAAENQFRADPVGTKKSPHVSPEKLMELAEKRRAQAAFAEEIARLQNAKPLPSGHQVLLHQQRPAEPNYELMASQQTQIFHGNGEIPTPDPNRKVDAQREFREAIERAQNMEVAPGPDRRPRVRPASPAAPIPGTNFLSTIGAKDGPEYKLQKLKEAKELIQQQAQIAEWRDKLKREQEKPLTERQQQRNREQGGEGGLSNHLGAQRTKRNEIPERAPHTPSPQVAQALATQHQRVMELQNSAGKESTITEENYMKRKTEQEKYRLALNSDRSRPTPDQSLGLPARISVHNIPQKGANIRNESMLRSNSNEIVKGPNVMDSVGSYDYDAQDAQKRAQKASEYNRQLQEAQANSLPVGATQPREALMHRLKQKNELTSNPFHHTDVYLGTGNTAPTDAHTINLPGMDSDKGSPYTEFAREGGGMLGLNLGDEVSQQMRIEKREKQLEFVRAAEQANSLSPIKSPRVSNYRHKYPGGEGDGSVPYELTADELAHNEQLLDESMVQDTELRRNLDNQVEQAVLAGVEREQAREMLLRKMAHEQYVLQLEQDARRNRIAQSKQPDRLSFAAYKPGASHGQAAKEAAKHEEANGYGKSGLPMHHNPYDWNENSLDFTWNSDQSVHWNQTMTDSARHRKAHGTHQMHYGERDGKPQGSPRSQHPSNEEHFATQAAYATAHAGQPSRYQQMAENQVKNTSLPLYQSSPHAVENGAAAQLHYDRGASLLIKNQDLYSQGLLTDRTAHEHEIQMAKYAAMVKEEEAARLGTGPGQGSYYTTTQAAPEDFFVPNLTLSKPLPAQESLNAMALQASRSDPQIVASITQGRTPYARPEPPAGTPQRSPAPRSGLTPVGNAVTIERNQRQGYSQPGQRTQVYRTGFPKQY